MKTPLRISWMLTLFMFTAGCSGYRYVGSSLGEVAPPPNPDRDSTGVVQKDDLVRLTLVDGEQVEGRVRLISSSEIVLDPGSQSVQPRGYSSSRIQSIEVKSGSGPSGDAILAISLGAILIGGVIVYQETEDLRNGFMSN